MHNVAECMDGCDACNSAGCIDSPADDDSDVCVVGFMAEEINRYIRESSLSGILIFFRCCCFSNFPNCFY